MIEDQVAPKRCGHTRGKEVVDRGEAVDRIAAADRGVTPQQVMKCLVSSTNSSINFDPAFWIDPNNGNH